MAEITIYQKPTCSTCREAVRLVRESGQPFTAINYYEAFHEGATQGTAQESGTLSPRDVLRTKEDIYKTLKLVRHSRVTMKAARPHDHIRI
ncbi:MAG: hypothetical protein U0231_16355 [Nitrospiraceae bacterium]